MGLAKRILILAIVLLLAGGVFAQSASGYLEEGRKSFSKGDYATALVQLRSAVMVPGSPELSEAYYWLVLTEIALSKHDDASKHIDDFLSQFPKDKRVPDMLYQKGRVLYLGNNFDSAIQSFQKLIDGYPAHELAPYGLYWSGECLFQLGQLEYAQKVFGLYMEKFPKGAKIEAATYRLSLISYKFREEELLKLLKWSHEEYLKSVEEFQKREKSYEQALAAYQKRVADLLKGSGLADVEKASGEWAAKAAGLEKELADAQKALAEKEKALAELTAQAASLKTQVDAALSTPAEKDKKIAELLAQIAAMQKDLDAAKEAAGAAAKSTTAPSADEAARKAALDSKEKLLALKAQALELKEYYLDWLAAKGMASK